MAGLAFGTVAVAVATPGEWDIAPPGLQKPPAQDRSASANRASRAVDARLKEQPAILLLEVIVVHTVGRLLARIPDTSEGIW